MMEITLMALTKTAMPKDISRLFIRTGVLECSSSLNEDNNKDLSYASEILGIFGKFQTTLTTSKSSTKLFETCSSQKE